MFCVPSKKKMNHGLKENVDLEFSKINHFHALRKKRGTSQMFMYRTMQKKREQPTTRSPRCSLPCLEIVECLRLMWLGILATVALAPRLGAKRVNTGRAQEVCRAFLQIKKEIECGCTTMLLESLEIFYHSRSTSSNLVVFVKLLSS